MTAIAGKVDGESVQCFFRQITVTHTSSVLITGGCPGSRTGFYFDAPLRSALRARLCTFAVCSYSHDDEGYGEQREHAHITGNIIEP